MTLLRCSLTVVLFAALSVTSRAADWPHWRGPNRTDVVAEPSGYRDGKWLADQPAWRAAVGIGCSSPLVIGDRLYITGWGGNRDTLSCLNAKTGDVIWKQSYDCPKYGRRSTGDKGIYAGPTSTPEYDATTGLLYTLSADGDLHCWNTRKEGRRVWHVNLYDRYKVARRPDVGGRRSLRDYGYTSSPLVHDDWLLVEVGAKTGTLMAFDKRSGKEVWKSECRDEAGHTAGAVPITIEGVPCAALLTLRNLVVIRLDKPHAGKTAATFKWTTDFGNNIPTPAVQGDRIVITSAYNHYAMCCLQVSLSGAKKIWEIDTPSGVCSPVIHDGNIYWAWRGVHCVDLKTGRELWAGGKVGTCGSCIVTSDDRLIIWSDRGDLVLAETAKRSPNKYQEVAARRRMFRTDVWPHVVQANGHVYCKDREGNLACLRN